MRDAIAAQERPMLYAVCNAGENHAAVWGHEAGHLWRTTEDINRRCLCFDDKKILTSFASPLDTYQENNQSALLHFE
jgi:hypothetical protein